MKMLVSCGSLGSVLTLSSLSPLTVSVTNGNQEKVTVTKINFCCSQPRVNRAPICSYLQLSAPICTQKFSFVSLGPVLRDRQHRQQTAPIGSKRHQKIFLSILRFGSQ